MLNYFMENYMAIGISAQILQMSDMLCLLLLYLNLKEELQQQKQRSTKLRSSTSLLLVIIDCVAVVEGVGLLNKQRFKGGTIRCLPGMLYLGKFCFLNYRPKRFSQIKWQDSFKVYYLVKEVGNESNFLHVDKCQCFLQVDTIIQVLSDMPKYPAITKFFELQ